MLIVYRLCNAKSTAAWSHKFTCFCLSKYILVYLWSQQIRSFNHLFKTRKIGKWKKLELQVFVMALMEIKSLSQLISCLLNIYNIFKRGMKHPWHSNYSEHQSNYRHHFPFSPSLSNLIIIIEILENYFPVFKSVFLPNADLFLIMWFPPFF